MSEILDDSHSTTERSAVVVVDVQNDFFHDEGAFARRGQNVAPMQDIVPAITELLAAAETAAIPRIFVRTEHGPWFDDPAWVNRGMDDSLISISKVPITAAGSWGAEFYTMVPTHDDLVLVKHRHSAFAYTPLELALRACRRDIVLFVGATTNVCIRASAVDALARGLHPVIVRDAVASLDHAEHASALAEFSRYYGRVADMDGVLAGWQLGGQPAILEGNRSRLSHSDSAMTNRR